MTVELCHGEYEVVRHVPEESGCEWMSQVGIFWRGSEGKQEKPPKVGQEV